MGTGPEAAKRPDLSGPLVTQPTLEELEAIDRPFSAKAGLALDEGFTVFNNTFAMGVHYNPKKENIHLSLVWEKTLPLYIVRNGILVPLDSNRLIRHTYKMIDLTYTSASEIYLGKKYRVLTERFTPDGRAAVTEVHSRTEVRPPDVTKINETPEIGKYMDNVRWRRVQPSQQM
ncbi:MAG: hypothetical protein RLZZ455_316 [Candidatus Parcubacteria bacterium]|jgi:hypothetical protein